MTYITLILHVFFFILFIIFAFFLICVFTIVPIIKVNCKLAFYQLATASFHISLTEQNLCTS